LNTNLGSFAFIRFALCYFFYFAVLGLVVPFTGIYLDGKGFDSVAIGEILAIFTVTRIIGPGLWAMLADKRGRQVEIIRVGALLALLSFLFIFTASSYWPLAIVLALFSFFWSAILPQLEVLTLNSIRRSGKIYSRIRLWGSIGFISCALGGGQLIESFGSEMFAWLGALILVGLWLVCLPLSQPRARQRALQRTSSIIDKLLAPQFLLFFFSGLLLQISFGPFYGFFALFLRDLGYSQLAAGSFISLGVVAEIIIFIYAARLLRQFSLKNVLLFCFAVTAIRWYMTGHFGESLTLLIISQLLHAVSFGLYHCAAIEFIQQYFAANQQSRGQAVYIGGVYGCGGALGAYLAGRLWQDGAGAVLTFDIAALLALAALLLFSFFDANRSLRADCQAE
jgi:PPP family 3-phenylpropionic acid transporter